MVFGLSQFGECKREKAQVQYVDTERYNLRTTKAMELLKKE